MGAAAAYSWFAAGLHPFTRAEYAATAAPIVGALVLVVVLRARDHGAGPDGGAARPGAWTWAALFAALTAWELVALAGSPREEHPTLSYLLDRFMSTHPGRTVTFALWLALGVWLARACARQRPR